MKKKQFMMLLAALLLTAMTAFAQKQLKGTIKDEKGAPIPSVNVSLKDKEGNTLTFTRSNAKGEYVLSFADDPRGLTLEATTIGYEKKILEVSESSNSYNLVLKDSEINLKTVVVKNRPSLVQKGDTLNYKTADFADKQDRSIGDVLKKMPGITVEENGKISYNGKPISALYQDGDNLLDDKYNIGTKAIPHGAVDKVQVIENDQPIKMLRKNNTSDAVALNLVIKDDAKMKVMGDIKAGLGTPNRFDGNLNAILLKKNFKFINNLQGNNIGINPANDLIAHNFSDYARRLENDKPTNFLSAGAAGVPTLPLTRSLFNKAGLVNLNNLYKFNKDLQLKANVSYFYDHRNQQYNKFSETYLENQTIGYTETQENTIIPQQLQAKFNFNGNTESYYLSNNLAVDYRPSKTNSNVIINGIGANQALQQQAFEISNELSYRKKLKSEDVLNFYSYLSRSTQPETLNIRPGLNEAILNNGIPFAGLDQYVKLPTWFTNNYMSFAIVKNKFTQTYKGGFNVQKQQLNSELYRRQNDQTTELVSDNMTNDLDWLKTKLFVEGAYDYSTEKFKASLMVPVSYNRISYEDPSKNFDKTLNKVFVNPMFNFKYQTSAENFVTANYAFKNDLGGLDDVYRGTVLKNYRSLFANDAPISERQTHSFGAGFSFRRAMKMLFFNLNATYTSTSLNTISSYTISNSIQQRVVLPLVNQMNTLNLSANASKYVFDWRSTVNIGVNYSQSKFDQLQNNKLFPFNSLTTTYKAGIDAKITNFLNWSYNANYTINSSEADHIEETKTKNQQLRQQSGITATLFKKVFLTCSGEHIYTQQSEQPDLKYLFADLNLRYKMTKLKTDLEFGITNLANVKKFEATYLSANSITSGTYYIPGRVAMLKATFSY